MSGTRIVLLVVGTLPALLGLAVAAGGAAPGEGVSVGIGPADAVRGHLDGVPHAEVADVDSPPFRARYEDR